ncbi:hypothetical protein K466DRAFT_24666 [Polyporus arcularius HHB13444]|uniref:Uncharacterized protein n=1 Tax=Polyporus arcularius HHB13444 TaxID=1314778 RepID=A0A5C3PIW5_9APHY|nr:hypothetical protein K466DRAFT_24666 [Polyporus arcularius HHB13444]
MACSRAGTSRKVSQGGDTGRDSPGEGGGVTLSGNMLWRTGSRRRLERGACQQGVAQRAGSGAGGDIGGRGGAARVGRGTGRARAHAPASGWEGDGTDGGLRLARKRNVALADGVLRVVHGPRSRAEHGSEENTRKSEWHKAPRPSPPEHSGLSRGGWRRKP